MVKFFNRYLPARVFIFAGLDTVCIVFVIALCLFTATGWTKAGSSNSLLFIVAAACLCLTAMYIFDLYDLDRTRHNDEVIIASMRAAGVSAIILSPLTIFFGRFGVYARYLDAGLIIILTLACLYRTSYNYLISRMSRGERILLIGRSPIINLLAHHIAEEHSLPVQLVAVMSTSRSGDDSNYLEDHNAELDGLIASFRPERVAIDRLEEGNLVSAAHLLQLRQQGIRIDDAHVLYEALTARVPVEALQAPSLAYGPSLSLTRSAEAVHQFINFMIASVLLLLAWPLFLLVSIWIRLDSKGPTFYKQERVGLHNRPFYVIKFRSMRTDAETESGPVWAQQGDSRITRSGRILRKLRLDELPQLWNVVRGDMSLVGPRPERPHFVEILQQEIPFYNLRHSIRPGITGWAQICAPYGASIIESLKKVEYDLFYLKNKSIAFDAFILVRTAKVCLLGRGAR